MADARDHDPGGRPHFPYHNAADLYRREYRRDVLSSGCRCFWILAVSIAAAGIWSYLDRERKHYAALHQWFHLFIRLALASQMFEYGMTKLIPNQFPAPPLVTLIQPVGHLSLQGLLWASIGASPAYEIFLGGAEILGGLFLLLPRNRDARCADLPD